MPAGARGRARADLKDVLERIRHFTPVVDEALVPLAHDEVQVLVGLAGNEHVVRDALLVVRERAPAVAVERLEQREARAVETRAWIERRARVRDRLDAQRCCGARGRRRRRRRGDEAEGEVRHGRVVVRQDAAAAFGREDRREHERGDFCFCFCFGQMRRRRRVERAVLLESFVARRAAGEQPAMDVPDGLEALESRDDVGERRRDGVLYDF